MVQTISQQPNPLPDRILRLRSGQEALDEVVFCTKGASASGGDAIGLTEAERKEVYWAVCDLVQNRLKKARSV
ncbi:MAG: hypothetical protein QME58_03425 [Bacteroidota bacterium]|nr:hypothetical protein [Bacteroidota bacterium]